MVRVYFSDKSEAIWFLTYIPDHVPLLLHYAISLGALALQLDKLDFDPGVHVSLSHTHYRITYLSNIFLDPMFSSTYHPTSFISFKTIFAKIFITHVALFSHFFLTYSVCYF